MPANGLLIAKTNQRQTDLSIASLFLLPYFFAIYYHQTQSSNIYINCMGFTYPDTFQCNWLNERKNLLQKGRHQSQRNRDI